MKKSLKLFTALVLILMLNNTFAKADSIQTKRLYGTDRYQTCSQIVNEGWKSSNCAVIVSGVNFPDALSASVLAKKLNNAPILLNGSERLDSNSYYQINRLNVKKIFIVGGMNVVSSTVEDQLHAMKIDSERFYGQDRTATSIAIAQQIGTSNGIILAADSNYTDALSIAPIAAKLQIPIILMPKDSVPDSVANFIKNKTIPKTYVLGGQDLISDSVASKFPNVKRIGGSNKYERNINIINAFSNQLNFHSVCLAYSENFADALSGSAFASLNSCPIILVGNEPSQVTKNFIHEKTINKVYVLGGTGAITETALDNLLNNTSKPASTAQKNNNKIILGNTPSVSSKNGNDSVKPMPISTQSGSDSVKPAPISTQNGSDSSEPTSINTQSGNTSPNTVPADDQDKNNSNRAVPHSKLQNNLYNYFMNENNRESTMSRAIELHNGNTSNNCVYFVSEGLRRAGLTGLPEYICNTVQLTSKLQQMGWLKSKDLSQLRPGDICFTTNGPSHTYTFMQWINPSTYLYAYVCDNQGNEYGGNAYHKRNIKYATATKEALDYFMYTH